MTAARPTKVQVGFLEFTIQYVPEVDWSTTHSEHEDSAFGTCEGHKAIITVRDCSDVSPAVMREALLHELLHACVYVAGLGGQNHHTHEDVEETFVRTISVHLMDVLQANPDVVKFLTG